MFDCLPMVRVVVQFVYKHIVYYLDSIKQLRTTATNRFCVTYGILLQYPGMHVEASKNVEIVRTARILCTIRTHSITMWWKRNETVFLFTKKTR